MYLAETEKILARNELDLVCGLLFLFLFSFSSFHHEAWVCVKAEKSFD
jgi:hypothetical protein